MCAQRDPYAVVGISADAITLRPARRCSAQDLCNMLRLGKRQCQQVFATGSLAVAGRKLCRNDELEPGMDVTLALRQTRVPDPASEGPVDVVWRDRFALAANKPAGLLVHGDGTGAPTLASLVQGHLARVVAEEGWPFVPAVQAVNRLDVETTGIVLFSVTEEFQPAFDALMASHDPSRVRKRYVAVVRGRFPEGVHRIEAPIARDRHDARRMRVGISGKSALTLAMRLATRDGLSLVACELRSGRRHQIRVHLAHLGHPIVGDTLYDVGVGTGRGGRGGLMLHAQALAFAHPVSGEHIRLHTDWPVRFAHLFSPREVDWSILDTWQ